MFVCGGGCDAGGWIFWPSWATEKKGGAVWYGAHVADDDEEEDGRGRRRKG